MRQTNNKSSAGQQTAVSAEAKAAPERHRLYVWVWRTSYVVNLVAFALAILIQPWQKVEMPAYWALSAFAILGMAVNIVVADIVTESICILLAIWMPKPVPALPSKPASKSKTNKYLVIYCLKSGAKEDVLETLAYMKASWRLNQLYLGSTWCLLSGTQDPELAAVEVQAVQEWNAKHQEYGVRVRYVRRMRGVLHKYGQYLDFIMLLNGYKKPMLYKDVPSNHPSGLCFDPSSPDVEYFCGSSFEFLVIMDRDNMLSLDFFHKANHIFGANPNIQILQPAITPYPKNFRRSLNGGESVYTSLNSKFQVIGNELNKLLRMHIPMASFYGKGILRRSAYNDVLLCLDRKTGATSEEANIPRDLISHDILEATFMRSMLCPEIEVYEDMPLTHVEWHLRQQRWDLGDLIIAKYLFPFTYGLLPNIFTRFSYRHVRPFFASKWDEMCNVIYTSTFNTRTLNLKCAMLLLMGAFTFADFKLPYGLIGLSGFVNAELVLLPMLITVCLVRGLTWKEHILIQVFNSYMGIIDIYFASFRTLRSFYRMIMRKNKWNTYRALGNSPLMTMVCYIQNAIPELGSALAVTGFFLWLRWEEGLRVGDIFLLAYLGLILTFPIYTFITSFKRGIYDPETSNIPLSYTRDSKSGKEKCLQSISSMASSVEDMDPVSLALGEVLETVAGMNPPQPRLSPSTTEADDDDDDDDSSFFEVGLGPMPGVLSEDALHIGGIADFGRIYDPQRLRVNLCFEEGDSHQMPDVPCECPPSIICSDRA